MRWKHPTAGSVIWTKKFAFFPKKVQNHTIWFEFYYLCEIYDTCSWDDVITRYKCHYLKDSDQVKAYLLTQSPLAKALKEEE